MWRALSLLPIASLLATSYTYHLLNATQQGGVSRRWSSFCSCCCCSAHSSNQPAAVLRIRSFCLTVKCDEQWKCNCYISLFSLLLLLLLFPLLSRLLFAFGGCHLWWRWWVLYSYLEGQQFVFCLFVLLTWFAVDDVHHARKVSASLSSLIFRCFGQAQEIFFIRLSRRRRQTGRQRRYHCFVCSVNFTFVVS